MRRDGVTAAPRFVAASESSETAEAFAAPLTRAALAGDLALRVFPAATNEGTPPVVGAEVELIPIDAATRRPLPLEGPKSTLALLRRAGAEHGWRERRSLQATIPEIELPDGGRITFEPGGQVEISSAPNASLSGLVRGLRNVVAQIESAASPDVELLARGIDPVTPVEAVSPQLHADRYRRMLRHFDRIGPSGARMMRQTASFQICVDGGSSPKLTWKVLNALAPYVAAIFANSARYDGRDTGHKSFRRHIWATLDPRRTGLLGAGDDPVDEYLRFALDAPAFLLPDVAGEAAPFSYWMSRGATSADWCTHLSTLFPEVRPRGYFELRSSDVVAAEWYAVPLVLVAGLVYHLPSLHAAAELLGQPDAALLTRAGRLGLGDPAIAAKAPILCDLALAGCSALGSAFVEVSDLDVADRYFDRYTRRARTPADD